MKLKFILVYIMLLPLFYACVEEPCYEDTDVFIRFKFYAVDSLGNVQDTTISSSRIYFDTILLASSNKSYIDLVMFEGANELIYELRTSKVLYYDCEFEETYEDVIESLTVTDTIPPGDTTLNSSNDTIFIYDTTFTIDTVYVRIESTCTPTNDKTDPDKTVVKTMSHNLFFDMQFNPVFVNYDCGAYMRVDSLDVFLIDGEHIDSMRVTNPSATNEINENIRVYF